MRGEWIEIYGYFTMEAQTMSLPMRGEWIEITRAGGRHPTQVSPHAGRVD